VIAMGLQLFRGKQIEFQSCGHAQAKVVLWTRIRVAEEEFQIPGSLVVLYKAIGRYIGNNVGK
jgi:hypothetical protein